MITIKNFKDPNRIGKELHREIKKIDKDNKYNLMKYIKNYFIASLFNINDKDKKKILYVDIKLESILNGGYTHTFLEIYYLDREKNIIRKFSYCIHVTEDFDPIPLLSSLKAVENCKEIIETDCLNDIEYRNNLSSESANEKIDNLTNIITDYMINFDGSINFAVQYTLREQNNIIVRKGESDSFGWLTGILETKKGKIIFG